MNDDILKGFHYCDICNQAWSDKLHCECTTQRAKKRVKTPTTHTDSRVIQFALDMKPQTKQRPRTYRTKTGKVRTVTPKATKQYEQAIAQSASLATDKPFAKGVKLSVSILIWRTDARRADIDNICKSVMDGMEGVVYHNDSQVIELYSRLHRKASKAGVQVTVKQAQERVA
ncbi:MAG: RusA family crossover junction endodeoxyribonuclease [Chloroflexota bacterium]